MLLFQCFISMQRPRPLIWHLVHNCAGTIRLALLTLPFWSNFSLCRVEQFSNHFLVPSVICFPIPHYLLMTPAQVYIHKRLIDFASKTVGPNGCAAEIPIWKYGCQIKDFSIINPLSCNSQAGRSAQPFRETVHASSRPFQYWKIFSNFEYGWVLKPVWQKPDVICEDQLCREKSTWRIVWHLTPALFCFLSKRTATTLPHPTVHLYFVFPISHSTLPCKELPHPCHPHSKP